MRSPDPRISLVIPVLNEARNLEVVLPALPEVHQVILVDGHSVDDSVEVAKRCLPDIEVVTQSRAGKGNALACGFERVTGDVVVMFDADGSAAPEEIPLFAKTLVAGADFAKGSRFTTGGGSDDITLLRKAGNAVLNGFTNLLLRTRFTDLCYGYNAFWTDLIPTLGLPPTAPGREANRQWGDGFEIETLINCRIALAGLTIAEVPSFERDRLFGTSNLDTFRDGIRVLCVILREYTRSWRRRRRRVLSGSDRVVES
ncbi:glycosyltransferase family 2 protein [Amycolatopsis sp. NPDC051903]|uniref:glycosyltransferase family 2 protein n=1 Tax=Amycolatopsis sp. NPDC051903 TaxID=3363936 RepID=UPI0037AAACFD